MDYKRIFILCSVSIFATLIFAQKQKYKYNKVTAKCTFVIEKPIRTSSQYVNWVWESDSGVVRNAKSAAALAYIYAVNLYGETMAKNEQPYTVNALNDSLWSVESAHIKPVKHAKWRGGFYMVIVKKTGKLKFFGHEK